MRNHISNKGMERGPEFQPPNIRQKISQYIAKHGPTPKVALVNRKTNSTIAQHLHQHALCNVITEIKCTEPSST